MSQLDRLEMVLKGRTDCFWQHCAAVLVPFAGPHGDLSAVEIEVFDSQSEDFGDPQPGPVEQLADQQIRPREFRQQGLDFPAAEYNRETFGTFGGDGEDFLVEGKMEHLQIEEFQGCQSLVLGGGGDRAVDCQMGQKGLDVPLGEVLRVFQVVVKDISFDPGKISLFGPIGVVLPAQRIPNTVEKLFLGHLTPWECEPMLYCDYRGERAWETSPWEIKISRPHDNA